MKQKIEQALATVFGLIFLCLSLLVAVETVSRKFFNFSLQGADELGGYALAVGGTIAFSLALFGRNHIRVDVLHEFLPKPVQSVLNWLSIVLLWLFAALMAWLAYYVIEDTRTYQSAAQTPWATPLVYPQTVWFIGLAVFALVAFGYAVRASWLLFSGNTKQLNIEFPPRNAQDELKEELDDLAARTHAEASATTPMPTLKTAGEHA